MAVSNMNLIRALVSQLRETQALACGGCGGGGGGGGVQTKTIITPNFKFRGYNNKISKQLSCFHSIVFIKTSIYIR